MVYVFFGGVLFLTLFICITLAALDVQYHREQRERRTDRRNNRAIGEIRPRNNNGDYYE